MGMNVDLYHINYITIHITEGGTQNEIIGYHPVTKMLD